MFSRNLESLHRTNDILSGLWIMEAIFLYTWIKKGVLRTK